ncbi:MAG: sugar phosphate isomerase/epimerase [Lachnospiraceae bacterium]|nr:sugar phosphate isomerase/epimerase [Lachnospiraceae bacterium]
MKREWLIVPDYEDRVRSAELAAEYHTAFEYDDFFIPAVYENKEEVKKRIKEYEKLGRDTSRDTLHGCFLDTVVSSDDSTIRDHSQALFTQSMEIAKELGVKGVVFHTGLIKGLDTDSYINTWLTRQADFFEKLAAKFPMLDIYMENSMESSPKYIMMLYEKLKHVDNFALCLDWAHASLQETPFEEWTKAMGTNIRHMHINDNDGFADIHAVVGTGVIDWKKFDTLTGYLEDKASVLLELNGVDRQRESLEYLAKV